MNYTSKKFLKSFLLLLFLVFIVSCEGQNCIEADDFGEYDIDTLEVHAKSDNCSWEDANSSGLGTGDEYIGACLYDSLSGVDISANPIDVTSGFRVSSSSNTYKDCSILAKCLNHKKDSNTIACTQAYKNANGVIALKTSADLTGNKTLPNASDTVIPNISCINSGCLNAYFDSIMPASERTAEMEIGFLEQGVRTILSEAYQVCISRCKNNCKNLFGNENPTEPLWQSSNIPDETGGSYGIVLSPNRKIELKSTGSISLLDITDTTLSINTNHKNLQNSSINVQANDPISFIMGGQWCDCRDSNGTSLLNQGCTLISKCGAINGLQTNSVGEFFNILNPTNTYDKNAEDHINRKEFLRRGVVFLKTHPEGYKVDSNNNSTGVPIEYIPEAWYCTYNSQNATTPADSFTCNTDYSRTTYFRSLNKDSGDADVIASNQLYALEEGASKTIGGYVIPKANLSNITNPFNGFTCQDDQSGLFLCTKNNELFRNSENGVIATSDLQVISINSPVKMAFKMLDPNVTDCSIQEIAFEGVNITAGNAINISSSGNWTMLQDAGGDIVINEHNTIVSNSEIKAVNLVLSPSCVNKLAIRIFKLNEILVEKSGFVSFKIYDNMSLNAQNQCEVKFRIINPNEDTTNTNNPRNNFYEYGSDVMSVNVPVDNATWSSEEFVRKGQIIRFDNANWEEISGMNINPVKWRAGGAIDMQCGVGMLMKIKERPALLCRGTAEESYTNPECITSLDSNNNEVVTCKAKTYETCVESSNACILGCFKDSSGNFTGPECPEDTTNEDFLFHDENSNPQMTLSNGTVVNVTKTTCQACETEVNRLSSLISPTISTILTQCYDLESYTGKVSDINVDSNASNLNGPIEQYGLLTTQNVALGAKKLSPSFGTNNYASLENFELSNTFKTSTKTNDYYYSSSKAQIAYTNSSLYFLVLNGTNFKKNEFKNAYENNIGQYNISTSSSTFLKNGRQLAIVLAHNDWDGKTFTPNTGKFINWVVKYDITTNEITSDSPYLLNNDGTLRKNLQSSINFTNPHKTDYLETVDYLPINNTTFWDSFVAGGEYDYRLFFKILDNEISGATDKYENNSGKYSIDMKSDRETILGLTTSSITSLIIQPIIKELDGTTVPISSNACTENSSVSCYTDSASVCTHDQNSSDSTICFKSCTGLTLQEMKDNNCIYVNDGKGLVTRLYKGLITNGAYQVILRVCFMLMLTFYGFSYLLGLASFTQSEMLSRLLKISFIYLMVGEDGWKIFNATFVKFFKEGVDYLVFSVAGAFEDSNSITSYMATNNLYDKSVLFAILDKNLMLILSPQVIAKVLGLLFVSIFGIFYVYLLLLAIFAYIFAISNALLLYLTAQVFISIFLSLGPIFFVFLVFEKTKGMFNKWIDNLVSFALQQVFLLMVFSFFNVLIYDLVKFVLSYRVCWTNVLKIKIPILGTLKLAEWWKIAGGYSGSDMQVAGSNFPGLFHILMIYAIAKIMQKFITFITNLANVGGLSVSNLSSGITKDAKALYGKTLKKHVDKATGTVKRTALNAIGVYDSEQRKAKTKENEKFNTLRSKALTEANKAEEEYRLKNYESINNPDATKAEKEKHTEAIKKIRELAFDKFADKENLSDKQRMELKMGLDKVTYKTPGWQMASQVGKFIKRDFATRRKKHGMSTKAALNIIKTGSDEDRAKLKKQIKVGAIKWRSITPAKKINEKLLKQIEQEEELRRH